MITPETLAELRRLYDTWIEAQVTTLSEPLHRRREPLLSAEMDARFAMEVSAVANLPALLETIAALTAERDHREAQLKMTQDVLATTQGTVKRLEIEGAALTAERDGLRARNNRMRMGLETISCHGCLCSPEQPIDTEERLCAGCEARAALSPKKGEVT